MTTSRDRAIEAVECMRDACSTDEERIEYLTALLDELGVPPARGPIETFEEAWERTGYLYGDDALRGVKFGWHLSRRFMEVEAFEEAWARMEELGYQYGEDALENVRLGWELARGEAPAPKKPAPAPDRDP